MILTAEKTVWNICNLPVTCAERFLRLINTTMTLDFIMKSPITINNTTICLCVHPTNYDLPFNALDLLEVF